MRCVSNVSGFQIDRTGFQYILRWDLLVDLFRAHVIHEIPLWKDIIVGWRKLVG